jgi:23S rRNA (cytosine1962-C5)-methyltransferase
MMQKMQTQTEFPAVYVKQGREIPFQNHHPWLFAGAIQKVDANTKDGDVVAVFNHQQEFIAYGLFNSKSQIRVRLYSWKEDKKLDSCFWQEMLKKAYSLRENVLNVHEPKHACRMVASEGDGLSGLTVDCYCKYLVVQFTSLALYMRKDIIISHLIGLCAPEGIYLRTEKDIKEEEGLEIEDGLLWGREPDEMLFIKENDITFEVVLQTGQKTGYYLDQRENRMVAKHFAQGKKALDMCCYTGGFALNMAKGGASSVLGVDVSASALELAEHNAQRNDLHNVTFRKGDAFKTFEQLLAEGEKYDLIVLDPPKFSRSKAAQKQALTGYRHLNKMAMQLLHKGGILITCSCSGRVSREEFFSLLADAARLADVDFQVLEQRGAASDHPVSIFCPEGNYLKCFIGRVS